MSDTYGPMSATPLSPFARWSPSLRTWTDTGLLALTLSLGTLPKWGCLHDGELFELPTPERPTDASESSSLLPSPISRDVKEQTLGWTWQRDGKVQEDTLPRAITSLLPTPTVMDMGANYTPQEWQEWKAKQQAAHQNGNGHGASLTQEAIRLLPTPTATAHKSSSGRNPAWNHGVTLTDAARLAGASTPPLSDDGSPSSDDPHLPPLFPAPTDDHD